MYYLGVFVFVLYLCRHYTEVPDLKIISARLLCCIPNLRLTLRGSFLGIELLAFSLRSKSFEFTQTLCLTLIKKISNMAIPGLCFCLGFCFCQSLYLSQLTLFVPTEEDDRLSLTFDFVYVFVIVFAFASEGKDGTAAL